jgi:hypothetical protein
MHYVVCTVVISLLQDLLWRCNVVCLDIHGCGMVVGLQLYMT